VTVSGLLPVIALLLSQQAHPETHDIMPVTEGLRTHDAQPLIRTAPVYPPEMVAARIEARCKVRFSVAINGLIHDLGPFDCPPEFHANVVTAIEQWSYTPRYRNGHAVPASGIEHEFVFSLEDNLPTPDPSLPIGMGTPDGGRPAVRLEPGRDHEMIPEN
jgi:hypothetical protein